jgi:hypothetical protein
MQTPCNSRHGQVASQFGASVATLSHDSKISNRLAVVLASFQVRGSYLPRSHFFASESQTYQCKISASGSSRDPTVDLHNEARTLICGRSQISLNGRVNIAHQEQPSYSPLDHPETRHMPVLWRSKTQDRPRISQLRRRVPLRHPSMSRRRTQA